MSTEIKRGRGPSLRGVVVIVAVLAVLALLALPVVRNTMHANLKRTCQGNLKEWAAIFEMYRTENHRVCPPPHGYETFGPASNAGGCRNVDDSFDFAPDVRLIFPEYATDWMILACPDAGGVIPAVTLGPLVIRPPRLDPQTFAIAEGSCGTSGSITRPGANYSYLGFGMHHAGDASPQVSEEQARAAGLPATGPANVVALLALFQVTADTTFEIAQTRRSAPYNRGDRMQKLGWPYVPYGGELDQAMIGPLVETGSAVGTSSSTGMSIDRSDVIATYPTTAVMWDAIHRDASGSPVFQHKGPDGCNVLFLDGHVEFKTYPGEFPLSKSFATMKAVR